MNGYEENVRDLVIFLHPALDSLQDLIPNSNMRYNTNKMIVSNFTE